MAFDLKYLARMEQTMSLDSTLNDRSANVQGKMVRMWTFNAGAAGANDNTAATQAAGYFLPATGYLNVGDMIYVYSNDPGFHILNVATNTGVALTTTQIV
jgi:hypothetical protein